MPIKVDGVKSAIAIDSYRETLLGVLKVVSPKYILEWGPGISTKIMAGHDGVVHIDTVEHNHEYYEKALESLKGLPVDVHYHEDTGDYMNERGSCYPYDLIFVDGAYRERCIMRSQRSLKDDGVVIIHDAERNDYYGGILSYEFIIFTDFGCTATVTNSLERYKKLVMELTGL